MELTFLVVFWHILTERLNALTHQSPLTVVSVSPTIPPPTLTLTPTLTPTPLPTATPTPTRRPSPTPKPSMPPAAGGSAALFQAVQSYRKARSIPPLTGNPLLCRVAEARAQELSGLGRLDGHTGIGSYLGEIARDFAGWGEIMHTASSAWSAADIVEKSWATSDKGHREALQNSGYTHGCGSVSGNYAVFIFGTKR